MSSKSDVWHLLLAREGDWLSRQEIEFVGGMEAMRRLREIRSECIAAGYSIESRSTGALRADEYRLLRITETVSPVRSAPRCVKCGNVPVGATIATIDPRWRLGRCVVCDKASTIFAVPEAYDAKVGMRVPEQITGEQEAMPLGDEPGEYTALDSALKARAEAMGSDHA